MNTLHRILATLLLTVSALTALAEQVNVTITPKRTVLPPHVMLYIANPGQYFNITIQNPDNEAHAVFFGAEVHQLMPSGDIDIVVPAKTMPKQGIVVSAGQTRVLDAAQLRTLFNHVRQSDIEMPQGLFDNVADGSFGLLEEGTYEIVLNAYKWDPSLSSPVLLSNPTLSRCTFTVCYQASAPKWVSPVSMNDYEDRSIATLPQQTPMLQWTSPVVNCNPTPIQYTYDLKIVQMLPLQAPDEAIERNPVVYQKVALTMPQSLIPVDVIKTFAPTATYVAQVTTHSNNTQEGSLDYVNLQNDGKSDLLMFRVKDYAVSPEVPKPTVEDEKDSIEIFGGAGKNDITDSLYVFKNPEITTPSFALGDGARKKFANEDFWVEWRKPWFRGGRGTQPDSLRFTYDVNLYAANEYMEREEMLKREPVYTLKGLKETSDTVYWKDIKDKVNIGDYLLLQVKPNVLNETSIQFVDDSVNVVDFALTNRFTPNYFECSNGLEITNTNPTKLSAKDLQRKTVKIGEYELVLDGAVLKAGSKNGHFSGTGHVIWKPMNLTWKLAVKFDDIAINTDNEVYEGLVETFEGDAADPISGSDVVNKLFTDWGIDNLIGDTGIPYADMLQQKVNGKVASLADELGTKIASYYQEIKVGKAKALGLLNGNLENVTFPLSIPDEINPLPVDVQISKMKFAPTYATMDFFGTYVVPETEATKNQILCFGAPRICISPKSLIPEGTTIALLKDFTVKDPRTDYDCTFKAPQDILKPENGCYVSWSNGKFEAFKFDVDMTLPNLKKVVDGKATDERPKLHITADIKAPIGEGEKKIVSWDWYGTATLDPFEHEDLPGYIFHAADKVIIDHSSRENVQGMPAFPKDYDMAKAGLQGSNQAEWMGVYIHEIAMAFPKDIKIGNGEEPMKVGLYDMFIDKSGMTVEAGIVNSINYKRGEEGTIGGFAFSLDTISVNFVQNQHKDFRFSGKMQVPLFKGTINYACNIYNQRFSGKGTKEGYAYVFKTWQMEGLSFDFMLGELDLNEKLTYLLVEALPDANGELKTNVELMLGGEVTIAGTETANSFIKDKLSALPIDFSIPSIKFCKMRLANNRSFEAVYERQMQQAALKETEKMMDEAKKWWNEAKDIDLCEGKLFLNFGQWGYASPQKKIGPFEFSLTKYDFDFQSKQLMVTLGGGIKFSKSLDISADVSITINAELNIPKDKFNFSAYSLDYKGTDFSDATIKFDMTGLKLSGTLAALKDNTKGSGYSGNLKLEVGGGLFIVDVDGGYYDYKSSSKSFSYGYFKAVVGGSKLGMPMGPITLTGLTGGFYVNCVYNPENEDTPYVGDNTEDAIGILFGVGLATTDRAFSGDFEFAVCVMPNVNSDGEKSYRLSTFRFDGKMAALKGMVKADVLLVYQNDDRDRYFQLNVTVDAKADGAMPESLKNLQAKLEEDKGKLDKLSNGFKDKLDNKINELGLGDMADCIKGSMGAPGDSFKEGVQDNNDSKTGKDAADAEKAYNDYKKEGEGDDKKDGVKYSTPSAHIPLDIRIQGKRNGQELPNVAWHVYLGEPAADKRCTFTLVDFESDIVTVIVGANAYFCLGSELPNNGQLPPLPDEVVEFLDGGVHGNAKSDNLSKALSAQQRTLRDIQSRMNGSGGVMLGASVYGKLKVDLGLFYASMGLNAGFDVSIVKLSGNAMCVNLGGKPGYKGWYGSGQLYAYLYAGLGFRINLGFFKRDIDLLKAGLGGVLEARMPNPSYFRGKCRAELKLLGGLVHINKTFQFTCGDYCQTFLGNALDSYNMFGDISMGYEKLSEAAEKPYSAVLTSKPQVTTTNTLDRSIRVIDPTEEDRIKNTSGGEGAEEFGALASRTFRFHLTDSVQPYIQEFNDTLSASRGYNVINQLENGRLKAVNRVPVKQYLDYTISSEQVILNLTRLNPGKVYRITFAGCAQEFRTGRWTDPEAWDSINGRYRPEPWQQRKCYYIATLPAGEVEYAADYDSISGAVDLQQFVKLAYPMAYDEASRKTGLVTLKSDKRTMVNRVDALRPMIALSEDISGKYFNKGTLTWKLYGSDMVSALDSAANKWLTPTGMCMMTPARSFATTLSEGTGYTLRLDYQWSRRDSVSEWTKLRENTVYGKAAAQDAYDQLKKTFDDEDVYRVTMKTLKETIGIVDRSNGLVTTSSSVISSRGTQSQDNEKYIVTVERYGKSLKTFTYTKELVSIPFEVTDDTTKVEYDRAFKATRLDAVYPDYGAGGTTEGFSFPDYSDEQLFGYSQSANTLSGFKKYQSRPWITIDPFAYLSYMANLNFVSGYRVKTSDYGLDITTTGSLAAQTPFDETFWEMGQSEGQKYNEYQIKMGYDNNVQRIFLANSRYENEQSVYPLRLGDSRVGEGVGIRKWVTRSPKEILTLFNNLTSVTEQLSQDLDRTLTQREQYGWDNKKDWKPWLELYKDKYAIFTAGTDEGNTYTLRVPYYQYAIVRMGGWRQSDDNVKTNEGNSGYNDDFNKDDVRHWRFYKDLPARAFYLSSAYSWGGLTLTATGLDLYSCDGTEDPNAFARQYYKDYKASASYGWRANNEENRFFLYQREKKNGKWGEWKQYAEYKAQEMDFMDEEQLAKVNASYAEKFNTDKVEYKVAWVCRAYRLTNLSDKRQGNFRTEMPNGNLYKAQFSSSLSHSLKRIKCTDYRVNAWDIERQCWTVYGGDEAAEANKLFYTVYDYTYDGQRKVLSNGYDVSVQNTPTGSTGSSGTSSSGSTSQGGTTGTSGSTGSKPTTSDDDSKPTVTAGNYSMSFITDKGKEVKKVFTVTGKNLNGLIQVKVYGEGFKVDKTTISQSNRQARENVTVTFKPEKGGTVNGTVTLSSAGAEDQVIKLMGICQSTIEPAQTTYAFGTVRLKEPVKKEIVVKRSNLNEDIKVTVSGDTSHFSVSGTYLDKDRASGSFWATYKPLAAGNHTLTITLTSGSLKKTVTLTGNCLAPTFTVSPDAAMTFSIKDGKSQTKTITVSGRNIAWNSNVQLTLEGYSKGNFSISKSKVDHENGTISATSVTITFNAKTIGVYKANLKLSTDGMTKTIELTGVCQGTIEPAQTAYAFGSVRLKEPVKKEVVVKRSNLNEDISITVSGDTRHFSLSDTKLDKNRTSGSFWVTYKPLAAGNHTLTVTLTSGSLKKTVTISGSCPAPTITVSPNAAMTFSINNGKSQTKTITVSGRNIAWNSNVQLALEGNNKSNFSISKSKVDHENGTISATSVTITFNAKTIGVYKANLKLSTDGMTKTIELTGVCQGTIEPAQTTYAFGSVRLKEPVKKEVVVKRSNLNEDISITVSGDTRHFSLSDTKLDKNRTSGSFWVTYKPLAAGNHTLTVTLTSGSLKKTVTISGSCPAPTITVSPNAAMTFSINNGKSQTKTITVSGRNIAWNSNVQLALEGNNKSNFSISKSKVDHKNGIVSATAVTIKFKASTKGVYKANLKLTTDGKTKTIELTGTCTQ